MVDGVKRGSKSGRPVEIQKNCVSALLLKRCDLFRPARSYSNMNCVYLMLQVLRIKRPIWPVAPRIKTVGFNGIVMRAFLLVLFRTDPNRFVAHRLIQAALASRRSGH